MKSEFDINERLYTLRKKLVLQKETIAPDVKNLHIFGDEVSTHVPKEKREALDAKTKKGYFIGYGEETKGYRVWYPDDNKIATVRDVVFSKKFDRAIEAIESKEATLSKKAMDEKFESLTLNNVWQLVEAFDNPRKIDCK